MSTPLGELFRSLISVLQFPLGEYKMAKIQFDIDSIKIISDKSPLFSEPTLDPDSYNVVATERQGTGPRYGMSVLPGQQHVEDVTLLSSEGTTTGYSNRTKVYGLVIQKMQVLGTQKPIPIYICASSREILGTPATTLDFIACGDTNGPDADVALPLLDSSIGTLDNALKNWRLKNLAARVMPEKDFVRTAHLSIGLADISAPWLLGDIISHETSTKPGKLRFNEHGYDYYMSKQSASNMQIMTTFTDTGKQYFGRKFIYDANLATWSSPLSESDVGIHFEPAAADRIAERLTIPAYTSGQRVVQFSDSWRCSQAHAVIATAHGAGATLAVLREERDAGDLPFQYADPQQERLGDTRTLIETGASSYLDNGAERATGWAYAPAYAGSSLAVESGEPYDGQIHIRLGSANSGLLRSGLEYELGYSLYDATTGTECNVCTPFKIKTGTDDYVAFSIFRNEKSGEIFTERLGYDLNVPVQKVPIEKVNYYQYRFYFRAVGSQEWLPAGYSWAVDYLFNGTNQILWCAKQAIGASIGGAAGQFNDYSALPKDNWKDVVVFQNRFFWLSDKQGIFSIRNNAFSYPIRNSISIPSGEFRGLTVHNFYGQAEQNGRLVLWASDAQYEGKFTGIPVQYPVTVSPDYTATFPLDGSDFLVQFRSTFTAFSSRSAVVAEGALFFWGEAGIFADSGVQPPNKISQDIEPWLDTVYDTSQISRIHCFFNESPKEIVWFYIPRRNIGFLSEAIVFNAEKNSFQRMGFSTRIDWSQNLNITQEGARRRDTLGKRIALGHTHSTYAQRMVFFDLNNKCGDLRHGREFLVKEIQAISGGSRLILADGFDIPSFADIPNSESILIQQAREYTEDESIIDGRFAIINIGSYFFDINETLNPIVFTSDKYMPIWVDKYSSIQYKMRTRYIMPKDHWQLTSICSTNICLRLLSDISENFTFSLFSNVSQEAQSQNVTIVKNANTHCIRRHTWPHYNDTTHGIGFGFEFSGQTNGSQWRLDWIGLETGEVEDLQRFEQEGA